MSMMHVRWGRLYKGTPAELALEDAVAELGVPYRTQFPGFLYGARFFVDFLLPTLGLVIEVDDPSHDRAEKIAADAERTAWLEREWGVRVVRCTNDEAINDPRGTVARLVKSTPPTRTKIASALPRPKKCPPKVKRDARMAARIEKRQRLVKNRTEERN